MDPSLELDIRLPPSGSRDLLREVHRQLRSAILDGRLRPGLRLPATRLLAETLGISRNTAVAAYDLLLSEGYLVARRSAGTFVAETLPRPVKPKVVKRDAEPDRRLAIFWRQPPLMPPSTLGASYRFDLRVGLPDKTQFPFHIWRRLSARALRSLSKVPAAYVQPEGRPALREAIAKHVSFARAVACDAEDVVVTNGAQQAFDLLARILVTAGRVVVIEDPCYPPTRAAFAAAGADIRAVPVDAEGLLVEHLPDDAGVICVTPSHQFPLGMAMSPRRRAALLDFAQSRGAVVIEDDYDGEFRFGGRPLDALKTLDRSGLVFYVGTFSKSLFPALRLGFVVAPAWARPALVTAKQVTDWHSPLLAQDTLAAFIAEGHLARHVRKMRNLYGDRRSRLQDAMARHCGGRLVPIQGEAGLHLAALLPAAIPAPALAAKAGEAGIGVRSLERFGIGETDRNGLVIGYGLIPEERIEEAIRKLAQVMEPMLRTGRQR